MFLLDRLFSFPSCQRWRRCLSFCSRCPPAPSPIRSTGRSWYALSISGWPHLLNPYIILASVFCIGIGFAFNAPAWTSIVPQVVSDEELPSAATLSGLQFNISGIIGPALGGLLLPLAGASFVFALNAACFLLVVLAARQWKQPSVLTKVSSESSFGSFGTIIRYV